MAAELSQLIRPIRAEEYPAEAGLVRAAYAAGVYAAQLAGDPVWERSEQDTAGRNSDGSVLVAEEDGQLLGAVSVLRGATAHSKFAAVGEAELRLLAVTPQARGRGLGAAMVCAGLEEALTWGVPRLRLDTGERNPAQRLYERLGFIRTPEHDADAGYGGSLSYRYELQADPTVRVRVVRESEIALVSDLVLAAYRDDYPGLNADYLVDIADVASRAKTHLVWVAEDIATGELLGTVTTPRAREHLTTVARAGEMDIRLLGVARAARGRGIGPLLTHHSMRLARIRGASRLVLETSTDMGPAWRMYERLDFERLPDRDRTFTRDDGTPKRLLTYGFAL